MERLDKTISSKLNITRNQAKSLIKSGSVYVGEKPVKAPDFKVSEADEITVNKRKINSEKFVYIMLNKPAGVVCASEDRNDKTVLDLLPDEMIRKGLFPAGRLDKNTTGFCLITDDGEFAHSILSPKRHVDKTYLAALDKPIDSRIINAFKDGVTLDGETLLPAELSAENGDMTKVKIVIRQGIYHQIKRMFKKYGITVLKLKRIKIGALALDSSLKEGEARYITKEELLLIK